ncbi:MAG TPA: MFS transporter [Dehalococcoidales bacterium]|nr:MFS transporter [Dehalococcoidales bacterium]
METPDQHSHQKNLAATLGLRTVSSLRNPIYRIYFLGMLGQYASMNMQMVAGSLLIYRLTGSAALLGTMSLAHAVPMIFLSIFGGAIADRMQKKQLLVFGLISSSLLALAIGLALETGALSAQKPGSSWILVLSSFLMGCIFGFMMPARQAIIPEMVNREQAMNAVALNMLGMNVLSLAAPAAAGFLIDAFDFAAVYYCMAGLNAYSAVMIMFIRHRSPIRRQTGSILEDIRLGFQYMKRDRAIMFVLGFTTLVVVFSMPFQQLLPIYVDDILKVGATGLGVMMSISGIGALVGSIALAGLPNKKRGLLLLSSGIVVGAALLVFAFSRSWVLSLFFIWFVGLGHTLRGTIGSALLQSYTAPAYMGRVMSILMMQWGVMSLVTFFAGLVAEFVPVQWVIGSLSMTLLIISAVAFFMYPKIRRMD